MKKGGGMDRRDFLRGVATAALAAGFVGTRGAKAIAATGTAGVPAAFTNELLPHPAISASPGTEAFWDEIRGAFALGDYIHMNSGTTGSQPPFSANNLGVYNLYKSADPRDWQSNLAADYPGLWRTLGQRQADIAAQYGANANEIVLSYNTTDALNLIFAGTPWEPGDRIITTQWEHNAMAGPMAWARDYRGVEIRIVYLPSNFTSSMKKKDILSAFEQKLLEGPALSPGKKQYLAFSEIFYKNGLRMPVKELCRLAKKHGAYTIVDTAHGWGMLPINCHDYEVDFLCGAGHKWLCGGPGTGIFYIRYSGSDPLPPFARGNFAGYGNLFTIPSTGFNQRNWAPTAMQGRGETNTPALYAMSDSAAFFNYVGVQNVYQRGVALAAYLKDKIKAKWGAGALWVDPGEPDFATFLTAFNPFAGKDDKNQFTNMQIQMNGNANLGITGVLNTLAAGDPKIYIRTITWRDNPGSTADDRIGFRVSTHAMYNNFDQIDWMFDRLVAAVDATGLAQLS